MNKGLFLLIPLVSMLLCGITSAQTQLDMNEAAARKLARSEADMNAVYKRLMAQMDEAGQKKLREAQEAWLKFRDAEAQSEADAFRGGSIVPQVYAEAARALTEHRTIELRRRLKELIHPGADTRDE